MASNEGISINVDLIEKPVVRMHFEDSPEEVEETKRAAFFGRKHQFFVFTYAGKPIYTKYGDDYSVSALCASFTAIFPKLQEEYIIQTETEDPAIIRYIRSKGMLLAVMLKGNVYYIAISKSDRAYSLLHVQLENLHLLLLSLLTVRPFNQLETSPSLDVKNLLDPDSDRLFGFGIKFTNQTPFVCVNGFPVLRVRSGLRLSLEYILATKKPENMLLGLIITGSSVVMLQRDKGILLNAHDINTILLHILAKPSLKESTASYPLCLSGIAEDGYLYLTMQFATPNVGVVFATLSQDDHPQCLVKAKEITQLLLQHGQAKEITKAIHENYLTKSTLVPYPWGDEIYSALLKDMTSGQISTFNLPFFSLTKYQRILLHYIREGYEHCVEPGIKKEGFEIVLRHQHFTVYASLREGRVLVLVGTEKISEYHLAISEEKFRDSLFKDPKSFFIV